MTTTLFSEENSLALAADITGTSDVISAIFQESAPGTERAAASLLFNEIL